MKMTIITCKICRKQRNEKPGRIKQGRGIFCSKRCFDISQVGQIRNKKGKNRKCLICKTIFYCAPSRQRKNLYCSKNCSYQRKIVVSKKTKDKLRKIAIKLGLKPPSRKGIKQTLKHKIKRGIFKLGIENKRFKGDKIGYSGIHSWLRINYGRANKCENKKCPYKNKKRFEWALLKTKNYQRRRENFWMLCRGCHASYDMKNKRKITTRELKKLNKFHTNQSIVTD